MDGKVGQAKRPVSAARAELPLDCNGPENTTLAPAVLEPPEAPCPIKQGDVVIYRFDTTCDTAVIPDIVGTHCTIEDETWINNVTLRGRCTFPPPPGAYDFLLKLKWPNTKSAQNDARLDGNTEPARNAEGPAHDDHRFQWSCPPPPGNDNCLPARPIDTLPYQDQATTIGATNDYVPPCVSGSTAPDVAYRMRFTTPMTVDISLCEGVTNFDSVLYVYQGGCPGTLIACNDDACSSPVYSNYVSHLTAVSLAANTDYFIIIDGYGTAAGNYQLNVSESVPPPAPYDICTLATPISTLPFQDVGTTAGYTNDYDEVCPYSGSTSPDVAYRMRFSAPRTVDITLCQAVTNYDSKLYVYQGSCPGPLVACNDDFCSSPMYPYYYVSRLPAVSLEAETDYWIIVDGYNGAAGNYELYVADTVPPAPPTCPGTGGTLFHQVAADSANWATAETSDTWLPEVIYDNFGNVSAPICAVDWWGLDLVWNDGWGECDLPTPTPFTIQFYSDDGYGRPDWQNPAYTYNVSAAYRASAGDYNGLAGWHWHASLSPCCTLQSGWISIQGNALSGCTFLWLNSATPHDAHAWQQFADGSFQQVFYDFGMCFTGNYTAPLGACCDETTGVCTDSVPADECFGPNLRFEADTLCGYMQPPCSALPSAACCVDGLCIGNYTQVGCTWFGGQWFPAENCDLGYVCPSPPVCPGDSLQAQDGSTPANWISAVTSDSYYGYIVYDNFADVSGVITGVRWWGLDLFCCWSECTSANGFEIEFYPADGNQPDIANPFRVYNGLMPTVVHTGILYDTYYGALELNQYDIDLTPGCIIFNGWISIQATDGDSCVFLWMSSSTPSGDHTARQGYPDGSLNSLSFDLGYCLTGEFRDLRGDLNCDGIVDFGDINPLILALSDPVAYGAAYPNCNFLNGDCNGDGYVDFDDINPFVAILSGGG
jgi:hypothetical protein